MHEARMPEIPPAPGWAATGESHMPAPIIFNPSRLDLPQDDHAHAPVHGRRRGEALLRGRAAHRLLELLPQFDPGSWEKTALAYLAAEAKTLGRDERERLFRDVKAILLHPDFGEIFGPVSRAEIAFHADYGIAPGQAPVRISGQIDRLVFTNESLLILDFKTGPNIPACPADTPDAYLAQLAAYRHAMRQVEPDKTIKTAILWTESPILMIIEDDLIERGAARLHEAVQSACLDRQANAT
jgi:ATP-dependent helicase/nuclease subunit A